MITRGRHDPLSDLQVSWSLRRGRLRLQVSRSLQGFRQRSNMDAGGPGDANLLGDFSKERIMWKVSDVEPVRVMGAEGYPYGFNVTTEDGKPVVSFAAYAFRALAEARATHLVSALLNAISVHPDATAF